MIFFFLLKEAYQVSGRGNASICIHGHDADSDTVNGQILTRKRHIHLLNLRYNSFGLL